MRGIARGAGRLVGAAGLLLSLLLAGPAEAAPYACRECETAGEGGDGTIRIRHGVSDHVPGRGSAAQGRGKGDRDYHYVDELLAPACSGNTLSDQSTLCRYAVLSCPALDQVRFWVWHRRVEVKVGPPEVVTKGHWDQLPGSYCLGPDDPGVPDIVRTLELAQAAFEERIRRLDPPTTRTTPGPTTLVHYPTAFRAGRVEAFDFQLTVAGSTVRSSVHPLRYTWHFGDGTTRRTTGPTTSHVYDARARWSVRVDVLWGGWFTVDGSSERYPIDPPARTTGVPTRLRIAEARAVNLA